MFKRRALTIFQRNHLFSCNNLTFKEIRYVLKRSEYFENIETDKSFKSPGYDAPSISKGSTLVNAFFEPDVRTSLSFETAMRKLGGDVINLNIGTSTKSKEESDEHTIKSIQQYADIMVLRHPEQGFSEKVSSDLEIPVINGGNRNEEHPTKTLLDLYTIYKHYNNFFTHQDKFLQILIIGDIKYSKTVHSLVDILKHYPRIKIHLLPYYDREPDDNFIYNISLQHNQYYDDIVKLKNDCDFSSYDVIYTTTLQKESENMSSNSNNDIVINKEFMEQLNENAIVMHPIPKNHGLNTEIDCDNRFVYLEQIKNGVYVRMAILDLYSSFAKYKHLRTEYFI